MKRCKEDFLYKKSTFHVFSVYKKTQDATHNIVKKVIVKKNTQMQLFYLQIMNVFCLLTDLKISLKRHLYFAFNDISLIFRPFN